MTILKKEAELKMLECLEKDLTFSDVVKLKYQKYIKALIDSKKRINDKKIEKYYINRRYQYKKKLKENQEKVIEKTNEKQLLLKANIKQNELDRKVNQEEEKKQEKEELRKRNQEIINKALNDWSSAFDSKMKYNILNQFEKLTKDIIDRKKSVDELEEICSDALYGVEMYRDIDSKLTAMSFVEKKMNILFKKNDIKQNVVSKNCRDLQCIIQTMGQYGALIEQSRQSGGSGILIQENKNDNNENEEIINMLKD